MQVLLFFLFVLFVMCRGEFKNPFVVIVDDLFGVVHAVFPLKIVVSREVHLYLVKESVSDVGADGFAKWGLYRSMLLRYLFFFFSFLSRGCFVVYGVPVSAFVECSLVWRAA